MRVYVFVYPTIFVVQWLFIRTHIHTHYLLIPSINTHILNTVYKHIHTYLYSSVSVCVYSNRVIVIVGWHLIESHFVFCLFQLKIVHSLLLLYGVYCKAPLLLSFSLCLTALLRSVILYCFRNNYKMVWPRAMLIPWNNGKVFIKLLLNCQIVVNVKNNKIKLNCCNV